MDDASPREIHAAPLDPVGVSHALLAYAVRGFAPVYWKFTAEFPSSELLAFRVLASLAIAALLVTATGRHREIAAVLRSGRAIGAVVIASLLIGTNWLVFIYAVQTDRILATSLGYYINPLVSVLFGLLLLKERLNRAQGIAVTLAAAGVAYQTLQVGALPWISLVLATTFGLYGLVRKLAPATPLAGFGLETLTLAPLAVAYLLWLSSHGEPLVPEASAGMQWLVAASGLITATPLVAFASAAKRLPLSALGMFQYIAPTLAFLLAVAFYGETFTAHHAVSFGCVWAALALYAWDGWQRAPRVPIGVAAPPPELYAPPLEEAPEGES